MLKVDQNARRLGSDVRVWAEYKEPEAISSVEACGSDHSFDLFDGFQPSYRNV